jgi:SAM-dependent methyltransferase
MTPERSRFLADGSHQARELAESFGTDAERYDRARPGYPDELVRRVLAAAPGLEVLDVGCGTGIAARRFQASGATVLGIDPDPRMADRARQRGLPVEVARFEDWDPAGRIFDVVIAGQAWHWVDPVAGAAKAARALRPGGVLALFWNAFEPPADLAGAFAAPGGREYPGLVAGVGTIPCARAVDGMERTDAFGDPEQWQLDWDRRYTRDEYLDQLRTAGVWPGLSPGTRRELLGHIGTAIDTAGGSFTMHYTTVVITATRNRAQPPPRPTVWHRAY